jgi:hypothetical protein
MIISPHLNCGVGSIQADRDWCDRDILSAELENSKLILKDLEYFK